MKAEAGDHADRRGAVAPALKTAVFTVLVPGTAAVFGPLLLLRATARPRAAPSGWGLAGALLVALGVALYGWTAGLFAFVGRGTPAPIDPPKVLVARGPYRAVRNPMYVAVLLVVLGESILFAAPALLVYAAALWGLFHLFVTGYEEPHLRRSFGAEYDAYRAAVPRWLPTRIPKPAARTG